MPYSVSKIMNPWLRGDVRRGPDRVDDGGVGLRDELEHARIGAAADTRRGERRRGGCACGQEGAAFHAGFILSRLCSVCRIV